LKQHASRRFRGPPSKVWEESHWEGRAECEQTKKASKRGKKYRGKNKKESAGGDKIEKGRKEPQVGYRRGGVWINKPRKKEILLIFPKQCMGEKDLH